MRHFIQCIAHMKNNESTVRFSKELLIDSLLNTQWETKHALHTLLVRLDCCYQLL